MARNPLPAGLLRERAREVGLADAGRAGDEHVLVLLDPAARGELAHDGLVELAPGRESMSSMQAGARRSLASAQARSSRLFSR